MTMLITIFGISLGLGLVLIGIIQLKIIKDDKEFKREMERRINKANNKIDLELYKRIQKKVVDDYE